MGKGKGHIPVRTCISCRSKRAKNELLRLALSREGVLKKDVHGKMPGRGAYVCKNRSCLDQVTKNKRLGRLFGTDKVIIHSMEFAKGQGRGKPCGNRDSKDFGGIDGES